MGAAKCLGKYKNCNTTVSNLMCHLMTYEIATKYSFDGRSYNGVKKLAFKELKICSFIFSKYYNNNKRKLINTKITK